MRSGPACVRHDLALADGSRWAITAGDGEAASVVSRLGDAMRLGVTGGRSDPGPGKVRRLLVRVASHLPLKSPEPCYALFLADDDGLSVCILRSFPREIGPYIQLLSLSSILARDAQTRGGVLLHGALAEKGGAGVILAAPGGTGKTTASDRLPPPWRSRCDDTTLVVRDRLGIYRAHPWPTWSRFLQGGPGGGWDVQEAVPLKGIYFLSRAPADRVEPAGTGCAAGLLVACAGQASQPMARGPVTDNHCALKLERFDNVCALARAVPVHVLHISLTGAFWHEIDRSMPEGSLS